MLSQEYAADVAELSAKTTGDLQYLRMAVVSRNLPHLLTAYQDRCVAPQGVGPP